MYTMKTTLLLMLSFLILFVLSANANSLFEAAPEPVRDIEGEELRAGVDYYIVSAIRGAGGGGVTLGPNRYGTRCPQDVVQEPLDLLRGIPVTFSPVNAKNGIVRVLTDLNIEFSMFDPYCRQRNLWKLDDFDEILGRYFITTTGVQGNPGPETLSNWFRIEKSGSFYKLVFCPSVCETCKVVCGDISVFFDDNGVRRLALSPGVDNRPFPVYFLRA